MLLLCYSHRDGDAGLHRRLDESLGSSSVPDRLLQSFQLGSCQSRHTLAAQRDWARAACCEKHFYRPSTDHVCSVPAACAARQRQIKFCRASSCHAGHAELLNVASECYVCTSTAPSAAKLSPRRHLRCLHFCVPEHQARAAICAELMSDRTIPSVCTRLLSLHRYAMHSLLRCTQANATSTTRAMHVDGQWLRLLMQASRGATSCRCKSRLAPCHDW